MGSSGSSIGGVEAAIGIPRCVPRSCRYRCEASYHRAPCLGTDNMKTHPRLRKAAPCHSPVSPQITVPVDGHRQPGLWDTTHICYLPPMSSLSRQGAHCPCPTAAGTPLNLFVSPNHANLATGRVKTRKREMTPVARPPCSRTWLDTTWHSAEPMDLRHPIEI